MSELRVTILKGPKEFIPWSDYIDAMVQRAKLREFLREDKIKDIDPLNPKTEKEIKIISENATVRLFILESISAEIHKEVTGISSAFEIYRKLKKKYGGNANDATYWIKKLNSIYAKQESDISSAIEEMKDIFKLMKKNNLIFSEDEKVKYLHNSLPESYQNRLLLNDNETFESLYNRINADLAKRSYVKGWKVENKYDDPMEIDYIKMERQKQFHYNHKQEKNGKFCHICNMKNHNTCDCWFNSKNKNSKYSKLLKNDNSDSHPLENKNGNKSNNKFRN